MLLGVAAVLAAVGVGVVVGLQRAGERHLVAAVSSTSASSVAITGAQADAALKTVTEYVAALATNDAAVSYALLDTPSRDRYGSLAAWVAAQSSALPVRTVAEVTSITGITDVTGATLAPVTAAASGTTIRVTAQVTLTPTLDLRLGLVPAKALGSWDLHATPTGWGIDPDRTTYQPEAIALPGENPAVDRAIVSAAASWIEGRRTCTPASGTEPSHGLVGLTGLADLWCSSTAPAPLGPVSTVDVLADPRPLVSAYGEDALRWARVVEVTGSLPMRLTLAPVGETWIVAAVSPV